MSGQFSLSDYLAVEEAIFGRKAYGLGRVDARIKVMVVIILVLANVIVAQAWLSALILAAAWLGLLASRTPFRRLLWFVLAPAWAMSLVVLGYAIGFGTEPLLKLGWLTLYREGLLQGLNAGLRVLSEMSCAAALVLTTPFSRIMAALRWMRLPGVLVDTLGYMYRYIFLLADEASAMQSAAAVRGGFSGRMRAIRSMSSILAHIFLRAYDRSQRIAMAQRARGAADA